MSHPEAGGLPRLTEPDLVSGWMMTQHFARNKDWCLRQWLNTLIGIDVDDHIITDAQANRNLIHATLSKPVERK